MKILFVIFFPREKGVLHLQKGDLRSKGISDFRGSKKGPTAHRALSMSCRTAHRGSHEGKLITEIAEEEELGWLVPRPSSKKKKKNKADEPATGKQTASSVLPLPSATESCHCCREPPSAARSPV